MAVIKIPDASFKINLWMFELPVDGVVYLLVSSVH